MNCKILTMLTQSGYCADIAKSPVLCTEPTQQHWQSVDYHSCAPFTSAKGHKWSGI